MDKSSTSKFLTTLTAAVEEKKLPTRTAELLEGFYLNYLHAVKKIIEPAKVDLIFLTLLDKVELQIASPHFFGSYHQRLRAPFDYYAFGLDFLRPLIDFSHSKLWGKEHLIKIEKHLAQGHNVVFLANHQIEADPQAISLLLEHDFPKLAEEMIFVAGDRVISDPLAVPFSLGRNLLCIYSKRYIDHPSELKAAKQLHNKKTMQFMSSLLQEGSKCIYVAPGGGRDRKTNGAKIEIAPFDPQSVEMFYLMAKKSKTPTFFYPLALGTYPILPPPDTVQKELGETRLAARSPIHVAIGELIDMESISSLTNSSPLGTKKENADKYFRRKARADYIRELVKKNYALFEGEFPCA